MTEFGSTVEEDMSFARRHTETLKSTTLFGAICFVAFFSLAIYCLFGVGAGQSLVQNVLVILGVIGLWGAALFSGRIVVLCSDMTRLVGSDELAALVRRIFVTAAASLLLLAAASGMNMMKPRTDTQSLDQYRNDVRLLFGIEDLTQAKLLTYSKSVDRSEAEFEIKGHLIKLLVTPNPKATSGPQVGATESAISSFTTQLSSAFGVMRDQGR